MTVDPPVIAWLRKITRHHMVLRCRCQYRGGTHTGNIKLVKRGRHDTWHALFGILMPHEVVAYIATALAEPGYFREVHIEARWEDVIYRFDLSRPKRDEPFLVVPRRFNQAGWDEIFGDVSSFSAAVQVIREWAPPDYFTHVNLVASSGECHRFSNKVDGILAA